MPQNPYPSSRYLPFGQPTTPLSQASGRFLPTVSFSFPPLPTPRPTRFMPSASFSFPTPRPTLRSQPSWDPVDPPRSNWDDVEVLGPETEQPARRIEPGPGAQHHWKLVPFSWPSEIVDLEYCLVRNPKHPVLIELVETAFDAWGSYLPAVGPVGSNLARRGLDFKFSGYCADGVVGDDKDDGELTIVLKKPSMDTTGVTSRRYAAGTVEDPNIRLKGADMVLDARLMQSAGLFYNTLLHEVGHLLGCEHPDPSPTPMAVMGSSVTMDMHGRVLQDNWYNVLQPGDARCIRELYLRDFAGVLIPDPMFVTPIEPRYPPYLHVSGVRGAIVPAAIPSSTADRTVIQDGLVWPTTPRPTDPMTWHVTQRPTSSPTQRPSDEPTPEPSVAPTENKKKKKKKNKRGKGRNRDGVAREQRLYGPELGDRRPAVSGAFSANSDVFVDSSASDATVEVAANLVPEVQVFPGSDAHVNVAGDADSRVTVAGRNNVDVDLELNQSSYVEVGSGTQGAAVNVEGVTRPDVFVGPEEEGDEYGYNEEGVDVTVNAESSPRVTVYGDYASINIKSNIVPSITFLVPAARRQRRERAVGAPPSEWLSRRP